MRKLRLTLVRVDEHRGVHPFLRETNVSGVYPPLGLAYLAGAARQARVPVSIIDAHAQGLGTVEVVEAIGRIRPDVVGLTSTTFNWPVVAELGRSLRAAHPGLQIWVGGPQLSLYPEECMAEPAIDVAVLGEGERTLVELLGRASGGEGLAGTPGTTARRGEGLAGTAGATARRGEELAGTPGTIVRRGEELVRGPVRPPERDLDSLPLPALDLLPLARYRSIGVPSPFVSLVTTRGCPFRCRFCSQIYVGGKYREHGVERVLEEMRRAVERFGAREVVFFDETFSFNRERVLAICAGILSSGLRVRWDIRTRADLLDDVLLRALKDAGCACIHVGIEAGTERVRQLMRKELDLQKAVPALGAARRLGLETRGYFMLGYPGETREEIEETIRLSCELPLDWASYTVTVANPGTPIFREARESGRIATDYWREYTLGRITEPPPSVASDGLTPRELTFLLRKAYLRFYLRPRVLAARVTDPLLWRHGASAVRTLVEIHGPRGGRRGS